MQLSCKEAEGPVMIDPKLLMFQCLFSDVVIYRETIFDNWRYELKRGWEG